MKIRQLSIIARIMMVIMIVAVAAISSKALAHSLGYRIIEKKSVAAIMFYYSGGKPASYAEVKIWSPTNDSIEFQNGRTDKNGIFTFNPDSEGIWQIDLNDGLGHTVTAEYETDYTLDQSLKKKKEQHSKLLLAVFGVSLIFNVSGLVRIIWMSNRHRFNPTPSQRADEKSYIDRRNAAT